MNSLLHELRLVLRSRLSLAALLLLFALSGIAVWSGLHEVARQEQTIARLKTLQDGDVAALAQRQSGPGDAGNAAYYTFYATWDAPAAGTFLALGLRDVAPYVLRVRALSLQGQLYDGESFNPELALPGRFDFAFVLIYLAPLFVIALLHDLVSGERQSGRLRMLAAMPGSAALWRRRVGLRLVLIGVALALPMLAGAVFSSMPPAGVALVLVLAASYLAFWAGVALLVGTRGWSSAANATALMGAWAVLTLVLPSLANVALMRAIPVQQGVDLMLAQRQVVHGAWEVPREETMRRFYASHPEWRSEAPLGQQFKWKWYFAFHQVGDETVAGRVRAYRDGLARRQEWTERLGWILPGVGAQVLLHRLADSDLPAQLAYQDNITLFHGEIRRFYYGYLFNDRPFTRDDFGRRPVYSEGVSAAGPGWPETWLPLLLAWGVFWCGARSLARLRVGSRDA